ncbi:hypothetical protein L227DRAFT_655131 [Lentinus tigrinus ALCF2SS1-6]|uniref:Uncharacterized protein n=1 Tax=Lentinus tigrinus ALCF2SS1-6 TaxID=1328759 RepID=A0A5C2S4K7_9APHY|nr:hypothetical protein L227DRAFT_655131 [Lentinus tigrinus ALCF2SS1-6]
MSSTSMGIETWGFVASLIGTVFLVPQLWTWLKNAMPSSKMRELDVLLSETEGLLHSALAEGTITYAYYDRFFHTRIWSAKLRADQYRATVYNINGRWHEWRLWMAGLSGRISDVMDTLSGIRAQIAATSSEGRQRLTSMGCTTNLTLVQFARREEVSNLILPDRPISAAMAKQVSAIHSDDPDPSSDCITPPTFPMHTSIPGSICAAAVPHTNADSKSLDKLPHHQLLPPIAYRTPTTDLRPATRVVLCRSNKTESDHDGTAVEHQKRHGIVGRLRSFTRFFRSTTTTIPHMAAHPSALPPSTAASSEKSKHLVYPQWEDSNPVTVHVHLPA